MRGGRGSRAAGLARSSKRTTTTSRLVRHCLLLISSLLSRGMQERHGLSKAGLGGWYVTAGWWGAGGAFAFAVAQASRPCC